MLRGMVRKCPNRPALVVHVTSATSGLIALSRSDVVAGVRELFLSRNAITGVGVAALAASPKFEQLEGLYLRRNQISDDGAMALIRSPYLSYVRELNLGENHISDKAADDLRARFRSRVNVD